MLTLETADSALKNFYLDAITREIDGKISPFFSQIEKTTTNIVGKSVCKVIKTGIYGGIGAGSETGDLPKGEGGETICYHALLKNLYGTIEISDKAIRASASDEGALVNLLNEEMHGLVQSAKYNFSRMLFGDGNGTLAKVVSEDGYNRLYLDEIQAIEEGMHVDVIDQGDKIVTNAKVVFVDRVLRLIELADVRWQDVGVPSEGARIVLHGIEDGYELTGLQALFSDEDIYDTDRSKEFMCPYTYSNAGAFELNLLDETIDKVEERSGGKVNLMFCSWKVKRYILQLARENNVEIGTATINNMVVPTYNGIPIVVDRFCPETCLYLLNTDDFKICQLCDWQWMEGEDGKILKQIPGKPVYTATLVKYAELICERPCGQGAIIDIDV